ncbi:MAG: hypothetical protein O3B68_20940, partial [Planctomycetota bacterium]|nr:hypothetical protein [Planctomycetota bacterium]
RRARLKRARLRLAVKQLTADRLRLKSSERSSFLAAQGPSVIVLLRFASQDQMWPRFAVD